jgi:hypothetical protein
MGFNSVFKGLKYSDPGFVNVWCSPRQLGASLGFGDGDMELEGGGGGSKVDGMALKRALQHLTHPD